MTSNISEASAIPPPTSWFLPNADLSLLNKTNGTWPWTSLCMEEWSHMLAGVKTTRSTLMTLVNNTNLVTYFFGILGSFMTVLTLCLLPKKSVTTFYYIMAIIGFFDGSFVVLKFSRYMVQQYSTSTTGTLYYNYVSGIAYTCSLSSDMITLCLTLERYLALAYPVFYQGLLPQQKRRAWFMAILISVTVAATRLHYSFDTFDYPGAVKYERWFTSIVFFSDTVVPFLITGLMVVMVLGVSRVVYKRLREKRIQVDNNPINKKKQDEVNEALKTVSLLAVLLVMFFLNQLGYISYTITSTLYSRASLGYTSPINEIYNYIVIIYMYFIVSAMSAPLEVISRSLPFYMYVVFSTSFRQDTKKSLGRFSMRKLISLWKKPIADDVDGIERSGAGNSKGGGMWLV